ncbi:small subunit ribosomal protein S4e [Pancytospora epiphaga]|nr:small subunit ribosomal protein S4e [Pancytospora epiphaga]
MPSGTHRHCKRLAAPSAWGLEKTGGKFAVRLQSGAHNKSLSIPLRYIVQRFLKVAETSKEVSYILSNKMISINGKEVSNPKAPVGLFDVITIKKTNQHYRLMFNTSRKFKVHKISSEEAQFRLTKVTSKSVTEGVPYTRTLDGFNFRFVDPAVGVSDTVKVDIKSNKVVDFIKLEAGKIAYVYSGSNIGRVGVIKRMEKLRDGKVFIYLTDKNNKDFTVLESKAIVIGNQNEFWMTLDEQAGMRLDEFERSNLRYPVENGAEVAVEDN